MDDLFARHREEYGTNPEIVVEAPGCVNLMGEHTDYNDGYVLQMALNLTAKVAVSRRKDNSLRFYAANYNERKRTSVSSLKYKREDRWANYAKGPLFEMLQLGYKFKGLDLTIFSDIPQKIGLASSAAIEIATAMAVQKLHNFNLSDMQIIRCAALTESPFMGKEGELTDQFTSYMAKKNQIVFLDLRSLEYSLIPVDLGDTAILITNSHVPLVSAEAELEERKAECEECVEFLKVKKNGNSLRDYSVDDLKGSIGLVPENIRRLCMHVVEENQRVLDSKDALIAGKLELLGKYMNRSHESLRDQYEVSCPEIDWLVKRAWEQDGVLGSRITGSGFGGCTVSLIKKDHLDFYKTKLEEYERIFGFAAETMISEPAAGIRVVYP